MATAEAYASLFTGDELDYAVAHALGNKYRGNISPGCHLIGESADMCVDLDDLVMQGKYTIYHYINGPAAFLTESNGTSYDEYDPDTTPDPSQYSPTISRLTGQTNFSVRPIFLQVYITGGDHLYQTIMVGAKLYWRDLWSNEDVIEYDDGEGHVYRHIPWRSVDLGIEAAVVSNSLEFNQAGTNLSLSQRMGTAIVDYIRRLAIGNANLLDFTNGFFMYSRKRDPSQISSEMEKYWNISKGDDTQPLGSIDTVTYGDISSGLVSNITDTLDLDKIPLFDDIDDEIITLFRADNRNCAFANYSANDTQTDDTKIINTIAVSPNASYTASVYIIYDSSFISLNDSAEAYITIGYGSLQNPSVIKTSSIKLNRLGSAQDYIDAGIEDPADAVYKNHIYDGTDYAGSTYSTDGDFKNYNLAPSQLGYYRLTVTLDQNDFSGIGSTYGNIIVAFGVQGGAVDNSAKAIFTLPKVEYGVFATQYNHSWGDLYYYFTNCEAFFGVPVDISHPDEFEDQDSFVYEPESGTLGDVDYIPAHFNAEPVAVGGGGGFRVHKLDDLSITGEIFSNGSDDGDMIYDTTTSNQYTYDNITFYHGTNLDPYLPISYKPDGENVISSQSNRYNATDSTLAEMYPRYKNILFLNKQTSELLCWDDLVRDHNHNVVGGFVSVNKPFVIRDADTEHDEEGPRPVDYANDRSYTDAYVGKNAFWIQKPAPGASHDEKAGILKYYDPEEQEWLTPLTKPVGIYKVQPTAPSADWEGKLWINSTTGVMYYSVYENDAVVWKPVYAAWGSNPSSNS